MLRIAIVGLGSWGKLLTSELQDNSRVKVVCGADVSANARRDYSERFAIETYADLSGVLNDNEVEAVVLATPHAGHEHEIVACAGKRKHVFVEKPFTTSLKSCRTAIDVCEAAGISLGIGFNWRYDYGLNRVRQLMDQLTIGAISHVDVQYSHNNLTRLAYAPSDSWRFDVTANPNTAIVAQGIHVMDVFVNLFGAPLSVLALDGGLNERGQGEKIVQLIEFSGGLTATATNITRTALIMRLLVFGELGWIELIHSHAPSQPGTVSQVRFSSITESDSKVEVMPSCHSGRLCVEGFADLVAAAGSIQVPRVEVERTVSIMEAAIASMKNHGQRIKVANSDGAPYV